MNRKYRNRINIIADILQIVAGSSKKFTHVMYQANLSFALTKKYLNKLLNTEMIRYEKDTYRLFTITNKGKEWLLQYEEYISLCNRLQCQLKDIENKEIMLKNDLNVGRGNIGKQNTKE